MPAVPSPRDGAWSGLDEHKMPRTQVQGALWLSLSSWQFGAGKRPEQRQRGCEKERPME